MPRIDPREWAFLQYLESGGHVDAMGRQRILSALNSSRADFHTAVLELGLLSEARLADLQAEFLGIDRIPKEELALSIGRVEGVSQDYLSRAEFVVIDADEDKLLIAAGKPLIDDSIRALAYFTNKALDVKVCEISAIRAARDTLFKPEKEPNSAQDGFGHLLPEEDVERLRDVASDAPVVKLLNRLVTSAVERKASDIHIEPLEDQIRIRFRLDGTLQTIETLDRNLLAGLISRVKILSRLNIAEQRLPQDGRMRMPVRGTDVDMRVSTAPVMFGETIVLRILDQQDLPLDFKALGYTAEQIDQIKRLISHPNGIVLVTGPTGSGKTTTLYSGLTHLNREGVKLFSAEDPIEYQLPGINQIQVKPSIGLDFAAILRSILRQDPDIIMIGEMRDLETARIAVQASLTGHLVLATLHTNSAAASVTRLLDMGVEGFLLGSALRGIVAQRLVRRTCRNCKGKGTNGKQPCKTCSQTGYSGRTSICEILEVNDGVRAAISRNARELEIEERAISDGMTPLFDDGKRKVAAGETTMEELYRVVGDRSG
jgi:general secretion pathway protein E